MLMVRTFDVPNRGSSMALSSMSNVPDDVSWQPPPTSFHAPVTAGSRQMARTAEPPPAWRCRP